MAILRLIDSVSLGISLTGLHTEPTMALVDTVSIGRSPVGGHVIAEVALTNSVSAGHASAEDMYDMSVIKGLEI